MVHSPYVPELRSCGIGRGVAPELQRIPAETETGELQSRRGDAAGIQSGSRAGLTNRLPNRLNLDGEIPEDVTRNDCRAVRNLGPIRAGERGLPLPGECCFVNTIESLAATVESSSKSDHSFGQRPLQIAWKKRRQIIWKLTQH
jgi:hypothetical protein